MTCSPSLFLVVNKTFYLLPYQKEEVADYVLSSIRTKINHRYKIQIGVDTNLISPKSKYCHDVILM